ncbi:MAG: hypothetical protein PHV93_05155, partial [Candidatus Pacebacteria bacterium]|nr:hypothetical protein [Candidatus Paceibacterota bacterium]
IQSEKFDFDYKPLNTESSSLIDNIKYWYYADKEQNNYSLSESRALLLGLIHSADEEMEIKYDIRDTGSIAFRCCQPGTILKDPYWTSDDLKDWKRAIKHAWMTPEEIIKHFEIDDPNLEVMARMDFTSGETYQEIKNVDDFKDAPSEHGSRQLVMEYRYIDEFKTTRLYGRLSSGVWIPFPLKIKEDDVKYLKDFYGIESYEDIKEFPYQRRQLRYSVVCPSATTKPIVEDKEHPLQCEFIGFFRFSAAKEIGIEKGVMESILDIQRTLNYRESKKDDVIASGGVGAFAADIDSLPNGEADLKKIRENKTKPDFVLGVHGDPNKIFGRFPEGNVPQSIWSDITQLIQMFDRLTPVTPALEGTGPADESGILFQLRNAVTKLGTLIFYDNWQNHLMWKAEAWYNQAIITYKGMYRKIPYTDKPGYVEFNSPMGDGTYLNQIETLPRARVVVTLSKESPTQQMEKRLMLYDMVKLMSANPQLVKPQLRVTLNKLIETLELTPDERRNFKILSKMQEHVDIVEITAQLSTLQAQVAQAQVGKEQNIQMLKQLNTQAMLAEMNQEPASVPAISSPTVENVNINKSVEPPAQPIDQSNPSAPGSEIQTSRGSFNP